MVSTRSTGGLAAADMFTVCAQLTIQGTPKRSVSMPKRLEKNVSPIGIVTVPPSLSALNSRSASATVSTCSVTAKPLRLSASGPSEAISTASPTVRRAWMTLCAISAWIVRAGRRVAVVHHGLDLPAQRLLVEPHRFGALVGEEDVGLDFHCSSPVRRRWKPGARPRPSCWRGRSAKSLPIILSQSMIRRMILPMNGTGPCIAQVDVGRAALRLERELGDVVRLERREEVELDDDLVRRGCRRSPCGRSRRSCCPPRHRSSRRRSALPQKVRFSAGSRCS